MPLIHTESPFEGCKLGIWKIEESPSELRPRLIYSRSEDEYMKRVTSEARRTQWMASRVCLKALLDTDDFVEMDIDKRGKPTLVNQHFHMSISHATDYSAVIICDDFHVGVDIESVRPEIGRIKHKFMRPDELEKLDESDPAHQILLFWSAKEVMYKIYAARKLDFRKHMGVEPFALQQEGVMQGWVRKGKYNKTFELPYRNTPDYVLVYGVDRD